MEQPHKRLECWKNGIEITKLIYKITECFPKAEASGLTSQMRRDCELDTQLIIAVELGFIEKKIYDSVEKELNHENRLITGLIKSLKKVSGE